MRVTMQTTYKQIRTSLNNLNSSLISINNKISSGKEMSRLSDDPVSLVGALGYRTSVAEIDNYLKNLQFGNGVIAAAENSLTQVKDLAITAKPLALQAVNASQTSATRLGASYEAVNYFEQSIALANSQLNGKYIFGGYRTIGYTVEEPTPFIQDLRDGYLISGIPHATQDTPLTSTVTNAAIAAGDLAVNGIATGVINTAAAVNGLNMTKAANTKTAIEAADPTVSVNLTTLNAGGVVTADPVNATDTVVFMYLNDVPLTVTVADGANAAAVANTAVNAINSISDQTSVEAVVGDGTNGGVLNSVVFTNMRSGDDSAIEVSGYQVVTAGGGALGFGNFVQASDATHNTGEISLSSARTIALTSPNNPADDSILTALGLGGGGIGFADEAADGALIYGNQVSAGDLLVNGFAVSAAVSDGISDVLSNMSAAAMATMINNDSSTTGVTASVTPAYTIGVNSVQGGTSQTPITGTVTNNLIAATDLEINTVSIGAIAGGAVTNGLNTGKALNARAAINLQATATGVTARLTNLSAGAVAAAGTLTTVNFNLNGVAVSFATDTDPAGDTINAINAVKEQTGITAVLGTGTNGGVAGSVVLRNSLVGDEADIIITGYSGGAGTASTGLGNVSQAIDATHNTGQISFHSENSFTLTSPNTVPASDAILNELGLGGGITRTGQVGDVDNDGILYASATTAVLKSGDLVINGVDIFDSATVIIGRDDDNSLIKAINSKTSSTGISASRTGGAGLLVLSASDGRNLHIQTTAEGEKITGINGVSTPQDKVHFGYVQLYSDRRFSLETTPTASGFEPGLEALGLSGGSTVTSEPNDVVGDGLINVETIGQQIGNVRYAGDRLGDAEIKIGSTTTLKVGLNGQDAIVNTNVFTTLRAFADALSGDKFIRVKSVETAELPDQALATGLSGIERYEDLVDGYFNIDVLDDSYHPPRTLSTSIPVNGTYDSLQDIATKIDGIPNLTATVDSNGYLQVETTDPDRFTFYMNDETSNFLKVMGIDFDQFQTQALDRSITDLEALQGTITRNISDFGARANRISVQTQIFESLKISNKETLSELEDTDIVKALMDLQAKEFAYEAALSSSSRVMRMSLVDFL